MKKIYSFLLSALIILVFNACQDFEVPEYQGEVKFSLDNVKFINTASPNARIETNSLWKHIYKANAVLNIKHTASGKEYTLDYNPNTFGTFSKTLPYGAYTFESTVAGGVFEEYLPYTASGQFTLESENLEISLTATTDYGLVTVKNQTVSIAKVTAGTTSKNLKLLDDKTYYYIYAKAETSTALAITETVFGTTINRTIPMLAYKHFNYIIDLKQGNLNLIDLVLNPFGYEEEVISSVNAKFFEENGTIKCPNTVPGETGIVNGKKYEAVDRALLIQRRDEGADLTCVCTSLVTDMSDMFNNKGFNQSIGNWDVSNVTNMASMFRGNKMFDQPLDKWDVSKVTNMEAMFLRTPFNQVISEWDVSNVTTFADMFWDNSKFNQPIGNWNVNKGKNFHGMFWGATAFNQPIGNWNVSNAEIMSYMFSGIYDNESYSRKGLFNQNITAWNVGNVTNMTGMFNNSSFNQPIGGWNVSKVTSMYEMFDQSTFNQPLGDWNVSSVTNMGLMFANSSFNQSITDWDVSRVTNMSSMFEKALEFNQPLESWNVSNVTTMYFMFSSASSFNQPIGDWNVSKVKTMYAMFNFTPFNQTLEKWDVSNVLDMNFMFNHAPFNQNISDWCVSRITSEPEAFASGSPLSAQNKPVWGTCPN
jgi:surface protein